MVSGAMVRVWALLELQKATVFEIWGLLRELRSGAAGAPQNKLGPSTATCVASVVEKASTSGGLQVASGDGKQVLSGLTITETERVRQCRRILYSSSTEGAGPYETHDERCGHRTRTCVVIGIRHQHNGFLVYSQSTFIKIY